MRISDWSSDVCSSDLTACAAERRADPAAAGDQLERPSADFLAGSGDADDGRDAPAAMRAFERLSHEVRVAYAFEAVVRAATGQLDQMRDQIDRKSTRLNSSH